ncbi:MAG: acyl-CoA mutase large subunit family protein, partial [Paramuribaculum sp.]|nr:acyl-CoA mutase large subunit family protein [Paramuribaculum sp.]
MAEKKERLFDQFPPITTQEWRAKVEADLKGVPFDKKLVWRTNEGFNVQPMYRAEDIEEFKTTDSNPGEYPFVRGTRTDNDWLARQEIIADTPAEANEKAKDVLTKGITSLGFNAYDADEATIATLLDGIDTAKVEINFKSCPKRTPQLVKALVSYLKEKGTEKSFHGSVDFNPFRRPLKHGEPFGGNIVAIAKEMLEAAEPVPGLKLFGVDSDSFCNAGAYIYQELGYALAWGAEWLTMLTEAGVAVDTVAERIKFNMGISSNYFMELAKFRAARMLWAQIVKQYNP